MIKLPVYSREGQVLREIELPEEIFEAEINQDLIYRNVVTYLANQRRGTASSKGRSEVSGSTKKPWRQKHTGRARSGTSKSPLWVGGGKSFGPSPRDYTKKLPKKMKRKALLSALSLKAKENKIKLVEDIQFEAPKTKKMAELLKNLELNEKKCLFIVPNSDQNMIKSCRNIATLETIYAKIVNTYTILKNDNLLMTPAGVELLQEVFQNA